MCSWFTEYRACIGFATGWFSADGHMACLAKTGSVARRFPTSRAGCIVFDGGSFGGSAKLGEDCGRGDCRGRWRQFAQPLAGEVET